MGFYGDGTMLTVQSNIDQLPGVGNCYVAAAVAANNLCFVRRTLPEVAHALGPGMGGTTDRAFRAMNLYAFSLAATYRDAWRGVIERAVDAEYPVCLGIAWRNVNAGGEGHHVVYVIGHEGGVVYARDQQNRHVLMSVRMSGKWTSEHFGIGRMTRACTVNWVGVGCPTDADARRIRL